MITKTLKVLNGSVSARDPVFRRLCLDILPSEATRVGSREQTAKVKETVAKLIDEHC